MAIDRIPPVLPQPQKEGKGRDWHRALVVSGILLLTGAAIVFTVLSVGSREVLSVNTAASVVSQTAVAALSMPNRQTTPAAETLVPTASDAPTRNEVDGAVKTAGETESQGSPAEGSFKEFQIWAAEEDARTQVKPAEAVEPLQSIEDAQAQEEQNARAEVSPSQKSRQILTHQSAKKVRTGHARVRIKHARAEIRPMEKQKAGPKNRPVHNARLARPVQKTETEVRREEKTDSTWLERTFGWLY